MLSHFQVKPLNTNLLKLSWEFSFYFQGTYYQGVYYNNGEIEWIHQTPDEKEMLESRVHDLMLFHVYEHDENNPQSF